jgi:SHAQKYF class myb-like DNA-binding protein
LVKSALILKSNIFAALKVFGKDWQKVQKHIGTRTAPQIRSHAQKFFKQIKKTGVQVEIWDHREHKRQQREMERKLRRE